MRAPSRCTHTLNQRWEAEHACSHEFMSSVRQELLAARVYVFTEGGRILNLARGATLRDAAKELGVDLDSVDSPHVCSLNMCESVELETELSNGDIVCLQNFEAVSAAARLQYARANDSTGAHHANFGSEQVHTAAASE